MLLNSFFRDGGHHQLTGVTVSTVKIGRVNAPLLSHLLQMKFGARL